MPSPAPLPDRDGYIQMSVKVPKYIYDYVHIRKITGAGRESVKFILGDLVIKGYESLGLEPPAPKTKERL